MNINTNVHIQPICTPNLLRQNETNRVFNAMNDSLQSSVCFHKYCIFSYDLNAKVKVTSHNVLGNINVNQFEVA